MKKLLEIIDEVAKKHGLEWYKPHSAEPIKKSSDPLAPLIQQAKANLAAVHKVASQEPRSMLFGGKAGSGRHGFVSLDPSKPNQWRVTHFIKGQPSGHTEADSFSDAIKKAHSYGYNVSKELSEEDLKKTEDLEKGTQSNKNKFTNAIKEIAKKHNLHDPNYSYWECDNFSRAAHKVAKEMGIKSEVWRSELEYDHDIKEIKAGEKHGHTFLKIDNEFHDYTASQATSKIPAVYVGNAPHPRHEGAIKNDDQDYYDKYGSDFWYDKIKEKLSEEDMEQDKMNKSEDSSRVSSVVVITDDKMLMLQRRDNNKWTFPGGHLNDAETHLEGAVRELWEEAGIRANPDEMILLGNKKTFQNKDICVYLYKINSEVKPSAANDPDKEAQKFAWLPHVLPEDIKENLYIPVGDNSSLSLFSVWLLRQKTNKLKELIEAKKSV